jgi:hypothetical protein
LIAWRIEIGQPLICDYLATFSDLLMAVIPFPGGRAAARLLEPRNALITRREPTESVAEHDGPLARVLESWRDLRGEGKAPPPRRKLVPEDHLRPILGFAHIVDCTADDPMNYLFRLFGSRVTLFGDSGLGKQRIADLPDVALARQTAMDYFNVVAKGCPAFHKIKTRCSWRIGSYTRLLLPMTDDAGHTTQLLVCVNPRPLPELGELPAW